MGRVRRTFAALALVPLCGLLGGCGSSGGSGGSASSATTAACTFTGSTTATTVPAPPVSPTTLTGVVPQAIGCTDQLTFNFSPAVPVASIAYGSGSGSSGGTQLVVTFGGPTAGTAATNVAYGGPSSVPTKALGHITSVNVQQGSGGAVTVTIGLPSQLPFATSIL